MICPHCGAEIKTRANLGQGTRKGKTMQVNENRQQILDMFWDSQPLSVRDVQARLVAKQMRRLSRRHTGWNYHTVQADLSILLAMGKLAMIRPHQQEVFDPDQGHTTPGVPLYRRL